MSGFSRTVEVRLKADTTYDGPPEGGHYVLHVRSVRSVRLQPDHPVVVSGFSRTVIGITGSEIRNQKSEGRRQKAEGRRQKAEGRRQKAEGRRQKADRKSTRLNSSH